jgi:formylglycine-generating enzyme required for sulfatase activity
MARPWGNDVFSDRTRANFNLQGTAEVGSYPLGVSAFGCLDMAGNVREWLSDQAPDGIGRIAVGGGWQDPAYMFDPSQTGPTAPDFAREALGFRLVWRP